MKKTLTIISIVLLVTLLIISCRALTIEDMDILGKWIFNSIDQKGIQYQSTFVFEGSQTYGVAKYEICCSNDGIYFRDKENIRMEIYNTHWPSTTAYTGYIKIDQTMSGSWEYNSIFSGTPTKNSGTFNASKVK